MRNRRIAAAVCMSLAHVVAAAEPTPLVNKLMNAPVSLFTFGLYRLNIAAADAAPKAGFSFGSAGYSWDNNELHIDAIALAATSPLGKQCTSEQACEKTLRDALTMFAVNFAVGPAKNGKWLEFVTDKFTQIGYTPQNFHNGKSLETAVGDLAGIVKISGSIYTGQRVYECRRELESKDVFCSSKAMN